MNTEEIRLAEDEALQRLEDTDPSTDDGRWGGDYCIHGRYIGTPGGADYLCGLCEDGFTYFVVDPSYDLMVSVGNSPALPIGTSHWLSNIAKKDRWALRRLAVMRRTMRFMSAQKFGGDDTAWFQMKKTSEGRWETPTVQVNMTVVLDHHTDEALDIEAEMARVLGVPADAVYVNEWDDVIDRRFNRVVYTNVEAAIDRIDLDSEQLSRVAAFEVGS